MAITVFPVAVTESSSINADTITAATSLTLYEGIKTFTSATYVISCVSGTQVNFSFISGGTTITSGVTTSGTVTHVLGQTADRIRLWINTGTNVVVTITKTAGILSSTTISGTLDTVTTLGSSTYTGTSTSGYGYAILVGGGGGGGSINTTMQGAAGGGSGGVGYKLVQLTGSMPLTIGAGGNGSSGNGAAAQAGGTSTFGGMTCNGGGAGGSTSLSGGAGGTVTGADLSTSASNNGGAAGATANLYPFVKNGTTGAGSAGKSNAVGGGDNVIGRGGSGAHHLGSGGNATGYGGGGGGASSYHSGAFTGFTGGNGTQGVLYVLRFFI